MSNINSYIAFVWSLVCMPLAYSKKQRRDIGVFITFRFHIQIWNRCVNLWRHDKVVLTPRLTKCIITGKPFRVRPSVMLLKTACGSESWGFRGKLSWRATQNAQMQPYPFGNIRINIRLHCSGTASAVCRGAEDDFILLWNPFFVSSGQAELLYLVPYKLKDIWYSTTHL